MIKSLIFNSIVSLLAFYGAYNFAPLDFLSPTQTEKGTYGATITTIQGSDTLKDSRGTINTNFSNLNTNKFELSDWYATTSAKHLTTLASLSTVGTITSGIWNGTAITVPYGGTGSTTLSLNQILLGNGTGIMKVVSGFGSSGQFLTSNGAGLAPTWQSASVNQGDAYNWTNTHTWIGASAKVGIGTSTPYARLSVVGLNQAVFSNINATTTNATSTFSGNLKIGKNATTTNLFISGNTYGGPMTYTGSSTAFSVSAGTVTYTGSIPTRANTALIKYSYGSGAAMSEGMVTITRAGMTVANVHDWDTSGESGRFEFGWTGSNFYVAENVDGGTTMTGTAYYYK